MRVNYRLSNLYYINETVERTLLIITVRRFYDRSPGQRLSGQISIRYRSYPLKYYNIIMNEISSVRLSSYGTGDGICFFFLFKP